MTSRRAQVVAFAAILIGIAAMFLLWPRENKSGAATASSHPVARGDASVAPRTPIAVAPRAAPGSAEEPSHIADDLNAPAGTARHDLEMLNEVFVAWQSNFPSQGNPVGENSEITAALTGDNPLHFVFIPRTNRAINTAGELCDRWGTPLRFHQVSGTQMEIRSAGPDRKFATGDDIEWPGRR